MTRARRHLVIMSLNLKRCFILSFDSVRGWGLVHGTTWQQIFEGLADLARRECRCSLRGIGLMLVKMRILTRKYSRQITGMYKALARSGFSREMNKLHCV